VFLLLIIEMSIDLSSRLSRGQFVCLDPTLRAREDHEIRANDSRGTPAWRAATANHIGKPVAILFDGQVVRAPTLHSPIGAHAETTGTFTSTEAESTARRIEMH
jgi:hypothetical protein